MALVSLVILLYDHLLTLADEVSDCLSMSSRFRVLSVSGDTPSHTSAVPDSTPPLGQNSALLRFSSWNSAPLPFPNSAPPSSRNSAPLSLLELPWM